jgi:hypothetical protein
MHLLTNGEIEQVSGGSVLKDVEKGAKEVGHAIANGVETAAGAVVGFFKGLF